MSFKNDISRFFGSSGIPLTLLEQGTPVSFAKGETILTEGTIISGAYCILEGSAAAYIRNPYDQTSIVAHIESGGFICDADILAGNTVATLAFVAESDVEALFYPSQTLMTLAHDPRVVPYITTLLANKVITTTKMYVDATKGSALKRVISALLDLDSRHRTIIDGSLVIDFDLSQQYLADYLNLSRLTVNKCIRRLTDEGLVRRVNDRYGIPDRARLEKYLARMD